MTCVKFVAHLLGTANVRVVDASVFPFEFAAHVSHIIAERVFIYL